MQGTGALLRKLAASPRCSFVRVSRIGDGWRVQCLSDRATDTTSEPRGEGSTAREALEGAWLSFNRRLPEIGDDTLDGRLGAFFAELERKVGPAFSLSRFRTGAPWKYGGGEGNVCLGTVDWLDL